MEDDIKRLYEIVRRVEACPQSYSNWKDAISLLSKSDMKTILMTLIDYGKVVPQRTIERLIIATLKERRLTRGG
jgi:hypothetical protein